MKDIKTIELFAGVGGFRLGLEGYNGMSSTSFYKEKLKNKIPFKVIYSNQWEPGTKTQHANSVYEDKFGSSGHYDFSISELTSDHLKQKCDLLTGGFPCQDYSVANSLRNSKGLIGQKGVLWWEIERILSMLGKKAPPYLLLENVDRLIKSPVNQRGRDFAVMLKSLSLLNYNVEWRVINAAEYGFPQRRRRLFLFGYKKNSFIDKNQKKFSIEDIIQTKGIIGSTFNAEINNEILIPKEHNLSDSIEKISKTFSYSYDNAGLMRDGIVTSCKTTPDYQGKKLTLSNILYNGKIPREFIISKDELPIWTKHKSAKKIPRVSKEGHQYTFSEGNMIFPDDNNSPSRTIITSEGGSTPSRFKHVVEHKKILRRLLPVELERLNMFPDNFTENENVTDNKRAFFMGNALVVGVVEKLGSTLSNMLSKN